MLRCWRYLLVYPDDESREVDIANGYTLGLCMGRVLAIDSKIRKVNLWWFFGDAWTAKSKWVEWKDKTTKNKVLNAS